MNATNPGRTALSVALCVAAAFLLTLLVPVPFAAWNQQAEDALLVLRNRFAPPPVDSRISLVLLDDSTAAHFSSRREERAFLARLADTLQQLGAGVTVFDLLFTPLPDSRADLPLARALAANATVAAMAVAPEGRQRGLVDIPPGLLQPLVEGGDDLRRGGGSFSLDAFFSGGAIPLGLINAFPDPDGVFRRYPLVMRVGNGWIPSLALRAAALYLQVPPDKIRVEKGRIILPTAAQPDGSTADLIIPVNSRGELLLNIPGRWENSFPHYTAERVVRAADQPDSRAALREELADGVILVADSSTTGRDAGPIPGDNASPLVMLHAAAMNDILTKRFLREPPLFFSLAEPLLLGSILFLCARRFNSARLAMVCGLLALIWAGSGAALFMLAGIVTKLLPPQLAIVLSLATVQRRNFLALRSDRERLRTRFAQYFSPPLLEKIIAAPELLHSFERKELTILFCDIVGFTAWCEEQHPEDVRLFLNRWYGELSKAVFSHGGTVGKFIGDGLLAYFGDPLSLPDHPRRAVEAACAIQRAAAQMNRFWQQGPDQAGFRVRIGIHTGEVVVGNLGSEALMEYTVVGMAVNLASRLEGIAPPGGVLVSESVCRAVGDACRFESYGKQPLKGFAEPVALYLVQQENMMNDNKMK